MRSGRPCTTSNRCRLPSCSTSSMAFLPGRAGRCHFRSQHRHAGEPCRTERAGSRYPGEKGIAAQPLGYIGTKPARDGLKAQKSEKARRAYREQHESDFIIADTAARYFREHGITKLPASKALQREIEQLTVRRTPDITTTGRNASGRRSFRQSDAISTRF